MIFSLVLLLHYFFVVTLIAVMVLLEFSFTQSYPESEGLEDSPQN